MGALPLLLLLLLPVFFSSVKGDTITNDLEAIKANSTVRVPVLPLKKLPNGAIQGRIPIGFADAPDRTGYVYLPSGFRGVNVPVMVIFHGLQGSGRDMISHLTWYAEEYQVALVGVDSESKYRWLPPTFGSDPTPDVFHAKACLEWVLSRPGVSVDRSRITTFGTSMGGYFAFAMATSNPIFTSGITHHSSFHLDEIGENPVPLLVATGSRDSIAPPALVKSKINQLAEIRPWFPTLALNVYRAGHCFPCKSIEMRDVFEWLTGGNTILHVYNNGGPDSWARFAVVNVKGGRNIVAIQVGTTGMGNWAVAENKRGSQWEINLPGPGPYSLNLILGDGRWVYCKNAFPAYEAGRMTMSCEAAGRTGGTAEITAAAAKAKAAVLAAPLAKIKYYAIAKIAKDIEAAAVAASKTAAAAAKIAGKASLKKAVPKTLRAAMKKVALIVNTAKAARMRADRAAKTKQAAKLTVAAALALSVQSQKNAARQASLEARSKKADRVE